MIKEDYVTFEQAKLLKEKGFPQNYTYEYHCHYDTSGKLCYHSPIGIYDDFECVAPAISLVQKWLREEKDIDVEANAEEFDNDKFYSFSIYKKCRIGLFDTYQEALSAGIDEALELI